MLLSLFTHTHNPQFLNHLARSIDRQTHIHFEWVIVPDGHDEIDVFRAHDALEHLRDPLLTMKEAHRCPHPRHRRPRGIPRPHPILVLE